MSVQSAESITVEFTTRNFATGVGVNADSLPTGTLVLNGTDNAATVTVTNVDTGRYKAQVTLPTLAVNDMVELMIAATVNSISDKCIIWRDSKDTVILADAVSHGGTLGSSTATFALQQMTVSNPSGDALTCSATNAATATSGAKFTSAHFHGLQCTGGGSGAGIIAQGSGGGSGLECDGGATGHGAYFHATGTGVYALYTDSVDVSWYSRSTTKDAVSFFGGQLSGSGHGLTLQASGAGKHDLVCLGDGLIQGDIGGRILGNTSTAFSGAGAQPDLTQASTVEAGFTLRSALRLMLSALAGKISGAGTTTVHIRDVNDTVDRILATVDSFGDRTALTLTP